MKNIEIKYRVPSLSEIHKKLTSHPEVEELWTRKQEDIYYKIPEGRLKMRRETGRPGQLIFYQRTDSTEARDSDYEIYESGHSGRLDQLLRLALGRVVTVKKRRSLFMFRNVRIHLDLVEGLGEFIELESVLGESYPEPVARENLEEINIYLAEKDLTPVPESYSDLLLMISG